MTKKKILLKTDLPREAGKLYYCGTDKKTGNINVCETEMNRKGKSAKKKKKAKTAKTKKKK